MAKLEIDLVDTKTEDENQHRETNKPGILHDSTIIQKINSGRKKIVWI